jgi:hypothetical protein
MAFDGTPDAGHIDQINAHAEHHATDNGFIQRFHAGKMV